MVRVLAGIVTSVGQTSNQRSDDTNQGSFTVAIHNSDIDQDLMRSNQLLQSMDSVSKRLGEELWRGATNKKKKKRKTKMKLAQEMANYRAVVYAVMNVIS